MAESKIVLVDLDGVLADLELAIFQKIQEFHPEITPIPLNDRKVFRAPEQYGDNANTIYDIVFEEGFFRNLPLIEGGFGAMEEMLSLGHQVAICSSPITQSPYCTGEKIEWVMEHGGHEWYKRLILTKDKGFVRGDILIDDKPQIGSAVVPNWEHVLYNQPYNTEVAGRRITWQNWKEVLTELV